MITATGYQVDTSHVRVPAAGLLLGGLVLAHLPSGVGIPCPLRSATGVPCPFCGLTTSVRAVGGGHLSTSLRAAPLGLLAVAVAFLALIGALPRTLRLPLPVVAVGLGAEWIFELARYHLI
jgi:uncharacterized protein DUF2752